MDFNMDYFHKKLNQKHYDEKVPYAKIARELNLSTIHIHKLKTGVIKRMYPYNVKKFIEYLDLDVAKLIYNKDREFLYPEELFKVTRYELGIGGKQIEKEYGFYSADISIFEGTGYISKPNRQRVKKFFMDKKGEKFLFDDEEGYI